LSRTTWPSESSSTIAAVSLADVSIDGVDSEFSGVCHLRGAVSAAAGLAVSFAVLGMALESFDLPVQRLRYRVYR
jgi:hypothetical protein